MTDWNHTKCGRCAICQIQWDLSVVHCNTDVLKHEISWLSWSQTYTSDPVLIKMHLLLDIHDLQHLKLAARKKQLFKTWAITDIINMSNIYILTDNLSFTLSQKYEQWFFVDCSTKLFMIVMTMQNLTSMHCFCFNWYRHWHLYFALRSIFGQADLKKYLSHS